MASKPAYKLSEQSLTYVISFCAFLVSVGINFTRVP